MKLLYVFLFIFGFQLYSTAQSAQLEVVDFQMANASIQLLPLEKMVKGEVQYSVQILKDTDSIYSDAKNMDADLLSASFRKAELKTTADHY